MSRSRIFGAALLCSAAVTTALSAAPAQAAPASSSARPVSSVVTSAADGRLAGGSAYWTQARMDAAKALVPTVRTTSSDAGTPRADGPRVSVPGAAAPGSSSKALAGLAERAARYGTTAQPWWGSTSSAPARTTGKLFFRHLGSPSNPYDDRDSWCSASAVNSEAKNLVFTAGHCVHGGRGGTWHTNVAFVPGYRNGARPDGTFYGRQSWSINKWMSDSDHRWDVGAVVMHPNPWGTRLVNAVGGQGIGWNHPAEHYTYAFGYPQNHGGGESLQYCSNSTWKDGGIFWTGRLGMDCSMTYGSSGGPWLRGFTGTYGSLHSVVSGGTPGTNKFYGAYFDTTIGNLYGSVRYLY